MELYRKSASELSALLNKKEISALELADATLARIEAVEPAVDAFLSVNADAMREKARAVDEKRAKGETLGALAGRMLARLPVSNRALACASGLLLAGLGAARLLL